MVAMLVELGRMEVLAASTEEVVCVVAVQPSM